MLRLIVVELVRLGSRRMAKLLLAVVLGAIVLAGVGVFFSTNQISETEWQRRIAATSAQCVQAHEGVTEPGEVLPPKELRIFCDTIAVKQAPDPRFHLHKLPGIVSGSSSGFVIIAFLLGASLVGAEFASRSMTTMVTWEPRRLRLLIAKVLTLSAAVFVLTVVGLALLAAVLWPSAVMHGTTTGLSWDKLTTGVLRGGALATITAVIAFALAMIGRSTAVALGIGFAYVVVIEDVVAVVKPLWRKWTLLGNSMVFATGVKEAGDVGVLGRNLQGAAVILVAVAVALLIGAASAFRARDIA